MTKLAKKTNRIKEGDAKSVVKRRERAEMEMMAMAMAMQRISHRTRGTLKGGGRLGGWAIGCLGVDGPVNRLGGRSNGPNCRRRPSGLLAH